MLHQYFCYAPYLPETALSSEALEGSLQNSFSKYKNLERLGGYGTDSYPVSLWGDIYREYTTFFEDVQFKPLQS